MADFTVFSIRNILFRNMDRSSRSKAYNAYISKKSAWIKQISNIPVQGNKIV